MVSEVRTTSSTGGMKGVKPERYELIPVPAMAHVARMYGQGAVKYNETCADPNWRKGYEWSKSYAALQRHANAFWGGEDLDPEMQLPHMAAVVFHALTLLTFMEEHPDFDDRYNPNADQEAAIEALRKKLMGRPDEEEVTPGASDVYAQALQAMKDAPLVAPSQE